MNLKPDIYVKLYSDITPLMIKKMGCNTIFVDLDGTLVSKNTKYPTKEVIDWIENMKENDIEVIILSNNRYLRVHNFSKELNVYYFHKALKPTSIGLKKAFGKLNIKCKKSQVAMIGDQIYTDTLGARLFGIKSIYVKPIDQDAIYTKFRTRITEKPFLRKFEAENAD